jgi:hypothetical protein
MLSGAQEREADLGCQHLGTSLVPSLNHFNLFHMQIARMLLGRRWSQKPDSERTRWIDSAAR